MNAPAYSLAAILTAGEPERLYTGLSLLVSTASEGGRCAGLLTFRALDLLLDPGLRRRALAPDGTPALSWEGRETFARSLDELRETALELEGLELYACSASVDTMAVEAADVEERLDGVMSTPRFLRATEGARLVVV